MYGTRSELYVHLVWATWNRLPLLTAELRGPVYRCILAECRELRVEPIAVGGVEDHVHLLVRVPTTVSVAQLVKKVKGVSSHLVTHQLLEGSAFKWQGGYGAFSVSRRNVTLVREYILNQEAHHSERTFIEAYEPPFPDR
jgi:putative transposase